MVDRIFKLQVLLELLKELGRIDPDKHLQLVETYFLGEVYHIGVSVFAELTPEIAITERTQKFFEVATVLLKLCAVVSLARIFELGAVVLAADELVDQGVALWQPLEVCRLVAINVVIFVTALLVVFFSHELERQTGVIALPL